MALHEGFTHRTRWSVALVAATLAAASCSSSTGAGTLPSTITVCETNTRTLCADWALNSGGYDAVWPQGSAARIEVRKFTADSVVFDRADLPGTTTPDMRARYRAPREGHIVSNGVVDWTTGGVTFRGRWTAIW
jgi:hypothetical protein